jgi:biopolymer transport protein ExbD
VRYPRNVKIFRGQLDAAPFLGVFFLLTIFLFLHSKMVFTPGVRINLPEVPGAVAGTANPWVVVAIDERGQLYYEGQLIREEALIPRLRSAVEASREPVTLYLQADASSRLETTLRLMSLVPEIGMKEALLMTRTRELPTSPRLPSP